MRECKDEKVRGGMTVERVDRLYATQIPFTERMAYFVIPPPFY